MLKSALIALALSPCVSSSFISITGNNQINPHVFGSSNYAHHVVKPHKMQFYGDGELPDENSAPKSKPLYKSANPEIELLLREDDYSQEAIRAIVYSGAYALLPDLKERLADKRISQIQEKIFELHSNGMLNPAASYFATYTAVRFLDEVAAPLAATLLLQARLVSDFKYKFEQGMQLPNIAELVFPEFIQDGLWFETIKTSEFPLFLEESLQELIVPAKKEIPVLIASELLEAFAQISERLRNLYLLDQKQLDDSFNKAEWVLAQSLVLDKLLSHGPEFISFWSRIYDRFKEQKVARMQLETFHSYLMSWIGVSYHGEEQLFQRLSDQFVGYRRRHDFYAKAFCKILEWHKAYVFPD